MPDLTERQLTGLLADEQRGYIAADLLKSSKSKYFQKLTSEEVTKCISDCRVYTKSGPGKRAEFYENDFPKGEQIYFVLEDLVFVMGLMNKRLKGKNQRYSPWIRLEDALKEYGPQWLEPYTKQRDINVTFRLYDCGVWPVFSNRFYEADPSKVCVHRGLLNRYLGK